MERTGRAEGSSEVPTRERMTFLNSATPGWFATYGTRLRAGRDFDTRDVSSAPAVGIVNETFIRRDIRGDPLGQIVRFERGRSEVNLQIVGVVQDAAYRAVRDPIPPVLHLPLLQAHSEGPGRLSRRPRRIRIPGAAHQEAWPRRSARWIPISP